MTDHGTQRTQDNGSSQQPKTGSAASARMQQERLKTEFDALPILDEVKWAISDMGYTAMTEVQRMALPILLEGREVIAKAPTGTGKTLAFGIPLVSWADTCAADPEAVILAPTRELAQQITEELRLLAKYREGLRMVTLYGGQPIARQFAALGRKPQIVIATPGRLLDHMNRRTVKLNRVKTVVLDECDEMLDMGFFKDVRKIIDRTPKDRVLHMFSATLSKEVLDIAWLYQHDAEEIVVSGSEQSRPRIKQYLLMSAGSQKVEDCLRIMAAEQTKRVMIFCNTKYMVDSLTRQLQRRKCDADCLHGDMRQSLRNEVMAKFRAGRLPILVATDVAARGIDVDDIDVVINYDMPQDNAYYLHRIGRTGRAGKEGVAYTLYAADEESRVKELMRLTASDAVRGKFNGFGQIEEIPPEDAPQPKRAPSPPKPRRFR